MNCSRCQELMSDAFDGSLAPSVEEAHRFHVRSCPDCAALAGALAELLDELNELRAPAPPDDLTTRILARTVPELRRTRKRLAVEVKRGTVSSTWAGSASWLAAAAVFALVLLWRPPELVSEWSRAASKVAHDAYSFGVRAAGDAERWITELNVLRITVGVAFEDRIDRLNERLRDLEEARRRTTEENEPGSSSSGEPNGSLAGPPHFRTRSNA